tara:strand:- start:125 stop:676 length:552 start_codon:yes stop_codon:yes gene_type:complete
MALIKTRARGLKLDDTFAFTGTVSGAGGISEMDSYRLTTSQSISSGTILTNWERQDRAPFSIIGSGMSVSSGIFTFPSTGIYFIQCHTYWSASGNDTIYAGGQIQITTDDSNYNTISDNYCFIYNGMSGSAENSSAMFFATADITNTSTHKFRFRVDSGSAASLGGSTDENKTMVTFIKLSDT